MLRKNSALAMAVGVMAAMALPAAASADWRHHGTALEENVQIGLTGQVRFQGGLGGIECQVTAKTTFQAGNTGLVETLAPHPTSDTTNCKGLGGLSPCQVHDFTPLELPWVLHGAEGTIKVTSGPITGQITGGIFCVVKHILVSSGTITATLDQPNTISSAQLSGSPTAQLQTNGGTKHSESVSAGGTLSIESPNAGTYSTSGPVYYIEGEEEEPIGDESEAVEAEMAQAPSDGWSLTMSNGEQLGPCDFTGTVQVWNTKTSGHTKSTKMKFSPPCPTSMKDCQVTAAYVSGEPWYGTLGYDDDRVPNDYVGSATNPIIFNYFLDGKGCGTLTTVTVTATAQGSVPATHIGKGCYRFEKAGTFKLSISQNVTGTLDATYCITKKGKPVAAK